MPKNAIILHGKQNKKDYYDPDHPIGSNWFWIAWLQKQLIIRDIKADTPEIPYGFDPKYEVWKKEVERFDINQDTALVGHSCGGGFWIRWLSENPDIRVGKVVLVAPSHGYGGHWDGSSFFNYSPDRKLAERTNGLTFFVSNNDKQPILEGIKDYLVEIDDIKVKTFNGYEHFTQHSMPSPVFPDLLKEVLES